MKTRIATGCAIAAAATGLALAVPATASASTPQIQPTQAAANLGSITWSFCINVPLGSSSWGFCLP